MRCVLFLIVAASAMCTTLVTQVANKLGTGFTTATIEPGGKIRYNI